MLLLFGIYALPLVWLIATSLKTTAEAAGDPTNLVFAPTTHGYATAFQQGSGGAFLNSTLIAGGTTLLTLLVGVPAAYGLARARTLVIVPAVGFLVVLQMIPQTTMVIPLYRILNGWGLVGSRFGVVLADAAVLLPFAILVLRPFYQAIPMELEHAAAVDGAGPWRIFGNIILPLAVNGITTVGLLLFIIAWGEFLFAITLLTNPSSYPLSALLSQRVGYYGTDWSGLMALACVAAVPIAVLSVFGQRWLSRGLTVGALK